MAPPAVGSWEEQKFTHHWDEMLPRCLWQELEKKNKPSGLQPYKTEGCKGYKSFLLVHNTFISWKTNVSCLKRSCFLHHEIILDIADVLWVSEVVWFLLFSGICSISVIKRKMLTFLWTFLTLCHSCLSLTSGCRGRMTCLRLSLALLTLSFWRLCTWLPPGAPARQVSLQQQRQTLPGLLRCVEQQFWRFWRDKQNTRTWKFMVCSTALHQNVTSFSKNTAEICQLLLTFV